MTMKFAPHVVHVRDQQRESQADREYTLYELGLQGIEERLSTVIPRIPRDEFEDMRDLLAARVGFPA